MSKKQRMFTAVKFAGMMGVSYPTVMRWLRRELVPGAQLEETLTGNVWQIPESALKMEKPKAGRKPKSSTTDKPTKNKARRKG